MLSTAALLSVISSGAAAAETQTEIEPRQIVAQEEFEPHQVAAPQAIMETPNTWTAEELNAMARTLSGECFEDKELDKRRVCEVILNRVSDGRFGDTICEVITAQSQFCGYWSTSRPVSENDLAVAEQTLNDWFANDCKPFSKYLYFSTGKNRENKFYETYPEGME